MDGKGMEETQNRFCNSKRSIIGAAPGVMPNVTAYRKRKKEEKKTLSAKKDENLMNVKRQS